jgi:hypothetical protein
MYEPQMGVTRNLYGTAGEAATWKTNKGIE